MSVWGNTNWAENLEFTGSNKPKLKKIALNVQNVTNHHYYKCSSQSKE